MTNEIIILIVLILLDLAFFEAALTRIIFFAGFIGFMGFMAFKIAMHYYGVM